MSVIFGRIIDNNQHPIYDVKVRIVDGTGQYPDIIALTDVNGEYDLEYISEGTYTVVVEKDGYESMKKGVSVGKKEEVRLDFVL